MNRIYKIKHVPKVLFDWFSLNFPHCAYEFYWYKGINGKTYGCIVYNEHGEFIHNATQATLSFYDKMENIYNQPKK